MTYDVSCRTMLIQLMMILCVEYLILGTSQTAHLQVYVCCSVWYLCVWFDVDFTWVSTVVDSWAFSLSMAPLIWMQRSLDHVGLVIQLMVVRRVVQPVVLMAVAQVVPVLLLRASANTSYKYQHTIWLFWYCLTIATRGPMRYTFNLSLFFTLVVTLKHNKVNATYASPSHSWLTYRCGTFFHFIVLSW